MTQETKNERAEAGRDDAAPVASSAVEGETATDPASAEAKEPDTVESLQAKIEALEEKLLRVAADFENRRKRFEQQRSDGVRFANVDMLRAVLVIVADFARSLAAAGQAGWN